MRAAPPQLRLANRLKYAGFRLGGAIAERLPPRLLYAAALPGGRIAAALTPEQRADVIDNLRHVLGPQTSHATLRQTSLAIYQNVVRYYADLLSAPAANVRLLRRQRLREQGLSNLTDALREGRGVVLATMHFGCPELALQAARAWGLHFFVVTEPIEPPELSRLFLRARASQGHEFMPVGLAAIKRAVQTLRSGGVVLVVSDRDIQGTGVTVPFFGRPARMPTGAVELARISGAPLVVAVSRRIEGVRAEVTIEPPLQLVHTGARAQDLGSNVALLVSHFEPYIRRDPEQWLVLQRLWSQPLC